MFGELKWQKDAKGRITTFAYDVLGRMTSRKEGSGSTVNGATAQAAVVATGDPNCNLDASVNVADAVCVVNAAPPGPPGQGMYYVHDDYLGSPLYISDASAAATGSMGSPPALR